MNNNTLVKDILIVAENIYSTYTRTHVIVNLVT